MLHAATGATLLKLLVCKATGAADAGHTSAAASVSYELYAASVSYEFYAALALALALACMTTGSCERAEHARAESRTAPSCLCVNMQDICIYVYVCMYVYMYIYIYVYIHIYIYI
jgi:hypothetical protein